MINKLEAYLEEQGSGRVRTYKYTKNNSLLCDGVNVIRLETRKLLLAKGVGLVDIDGHSFGLRPHLPGQVVENRKQKTSASPGIRELHSSVLMHFAGAPGAPAFFSAKRRKHFQESSHFQLYM